MNFFDLDKELRDGIDIRKKMRAVSQSLNCRFGVSTSSLPRPDLKEL